MKNIFKILLLTSIVTACSGEKKGKSIEDILASNNLTQLKEKREEIDAKQQEYSELLERINEKISELDTIKKLPLVTSVMVAPQVFNHYLELQGSVQTKENLVIYPEAGGILSSVYVKEGQKVSKGQLLGKIDDGGLSQQVAQLEIQAALAKTTFERQERLWKQNIGSEIQYLQAKSSYEAQQRAVSQLKSQLEKTNVRAPFTGVIDDVITDQGSVVAPGQSPLFRIVNLDNMYIETDVPENYITSVTTNKDVKIEFPVLGQTLDAKIRQAGNFINPANRTFKIEVAVPNKDKNIKPNLTARLKINDYSNEKAILVPQNIISENAEGQQYIYIIENKNNVNEGTAKQIIIETGKSQGDLIEVTKGLESNAEIIQEGARTVKEGQTVKVINQ